MPLELYGVLHEFRTWKGRCVGQVHSVPIRLSPNTTRYGVPEIYANPGQLQPTNLEEQGYASITMSLGHDFIYFFAPLPVVGLGTNRINTVHSWVQAKTWTSCSDLEHARAFSVLPVKKVETEASFMKFGWIIFKYHTRRFAKTAPESDDTGGYVRVSVLPAPFFSFS